MVRLIMGANGAGKTKQLIELIHTSVESETGSVVCIEPKGDMTYDVSYNVRLVNAGEYNVDSFDCLRGFLCGMYAGNYDISHVFVDNLCKIAGSNDLQAVETFLHWLDRFSEENGVKFTVTISAKRFSVKPMTTDEAVLQMNLLGHSFYVFRNIETNAVCVVYHRNNGGYGLIETEE